MNEDPLAAFDQILRGMVDVSKILHAHLEALIGQGFTRDEAVRLVAELQKTLFATGLRRSGDEL